MVTRIAWGDEYSLRMPCKHTIRFISKTNRCNNNTKIHIKHFIHCSCSCAFGRWTAKYTHAATATNPVPHSTEFKCWLATFWLGSLLRFSPHTCSLNLDGASKSVWKANRKKKRITREENLLAHMPNECVNENTHVWFRTINLYGFVKCVLKR